ncbi:hypothetical protein HYALB_00007393 [Hymenoscyphus albidus]|uniref:GAT domain-containing protein n=1 Tax=Hymenoscyphus albidus TaxID=595503 RepID=A0A9N9LW15_9HELO|nr:hypothetical protein HYALB_00007393 [Hymenoscyphus albidus]
MKAMKSMNVNRMLGSLKRKPRETVSPAEVEEEVIDPQADTPEASAVRNVRKFCESGGPNGSGEEVLFLPAIVEACESSPSAAKASAYAIRKYLSKDNFAKPYIQYNAIMLIRILADNPGKTFTRNMDSKFVQTVKELLRMGRDPSVRQILMETLDTFQRKKADDEGCAMLNEMWKREQEKMVKLAGPAGPRTLNAPPHDNSQNYFARNHHSKRLPAPHELSSRIEEARTSAQLLSQTVQSTPPSEFLQNELVREFADRCQSASRSVQAYMVAENPAPDNQTMLTLIETNEQLNKAMNQHQRAVLAARQAAGIGSQSNTPPPRTDSGFAPPPGPPPNRATSKSSKYTPPVPPPGDFAPTGLDEDPFADPKESKSKSKSRSPPFPKDQPQQATGQFNDNHGVEPYHPGFRETESYPARQDSSVGSATMSAAGGEARNAGLEDSYGVPPPKNKTPVYKY